MRTDGARESRDSIKNIWGKGAIQGGENLESRLHNRSIIL
jgi:hypothetical protein